MDIFNNLCIKFLNLNFYLSNTQLVIYHVLNITLNHFHSNICINILSSLYLIIVMRVNLTLLKNAIVDQLAQLILFLVLTKKTLINLLISNDKIDL